MTITRTTPIGDLPELLRPAEAAVLLGVSTGLVYELVRRNEIDHVRLGRLVRIRRSAIGGGHDVD